MNLNFIYDRDFRKPFPGVSLSSIHESVSKVVK